MKGKVVMVHSNNTLETDPMRCWVVDSDMRLLVGNRMAMRDNIPLRCLDILVEIVVDELDMTFLLSEVIPGNRLGRKGRTADYLRSQVEQCQ